MRKLEDIETRLESQGFKIMERGFDGFGAINVKKRQTIICSYVGGWEHVSINAPMTPSWDDMCALKEMFWTDEETVVQFHPRKSEYVSNLEHCLHLWRPIEKFVGKMPVPDSILVGIKGLKLD